MSIDNLELVFQKSDELDRKTAVTSYVKYHTLTSIIAVKHGFSERVGAAVFAALSPNNDYHGNLRDTDRLLSAAHDGLAIDDFKVSTYGPNKRKAWAIAHGSDPLSVLTALKTRSFYMNVEDPTNPIPVTVDGHMRNMWFQEHKPLQSRNPNLRAVRVDAKLYEEITVAVRNLAIKHGYIANQMQGILWITWRRINRILTPNQLSLWDRDYQAANLGFVCS